MTLYVAICAVCFLLALIGGRELLPVTVVVVAITAGLLIAHAAAHHAFL